jgi:uncharacterized protein (DUF1330 family)
VSGADRVVLGTRHCRALQTDPNLRTTFIAMVIAGAKMSQISGYTPIALLVAGLTTGILGSAQAAPVYVVDEVEVTDAAVYKSYVERQVPLIKAAGGRFVVQGGALTPIEGVPPAPRVVIYFFESAEKLQAWRNGPEQKELIALRDRSSHFRSFSVEGLPN